MYAWPLVKALVVQPALPPLPSILLKEAEAALEITQATVAAPIVLPAE